MTEIKWQPIGTAPMDGSDILVAMPFGMPPRVAGYFHGGWYSFERPEDEIFPTHWVPLPPPPQ